MNVRHLTKIMIKKNLFEDVTCKQINLDIILIDILNIISIKYTNIKNKNYIN